MYYRNNFFPKCCDVLIYAIVQQIKVYQGRIQDFKLGGAHLKKIAPSGGRRENFWGISCEKSRFYAKKKITFFPILGGTRAGCAPPGSAPCIKCRWRQWCNCWFASLKCGRLWSPAIPNLILVVAASLLSIKE